jgi:hypothetical protein
VSFSFSLEAGGTGLTRVEPGMDSMAITYLAGREMRYSRPWMRGVILIRALKRRVRRLRSPRSVSRLQLLMSRLMDVSIPAGLGVDMETKAA